MAQVYIIGSEGQEILPCQSTQTQRFNTEPRTIGIDISYFKQDGLHLVKLMMTVEETVHLITKLSNEVFHSL